MRYENSEAAYASQFVVNASDEEVIIGFSSGVVPDGEDNPVLPVFSRVAMTRQGAQRLIDTLAKALEDSPAGAAGDSAARFPALN